MVERFRVSGRPVARGAVLAALLTLLATLPALAHARYERSAPGDGAVVSEAPELVEIWFTQELFRRAGENYIQVEDAGGARVEVGQAEIDDDDRTHLSVALAPDLAPGSYLVRWRNLSAEDGDSDDGEFGFTFDPQAPVTSTPMQAVTATAPPTVTQPPTVTELPQATVVPEATLLAPSPTAETTAQPTEGSGCALGLLPIVALMALIAPGRMWRRRRL